MYKKRWEETVKKKTLEEPNSKSMNEFEKLIVEFDENFLGLRMTPDGRVLSAFLVQCI